MGRRSTTIEEFLEKRCRPPKPVPTGLPVVLTNGCRERIGYRKKGGYVEARQSGIKWLAHRLAYTLSKGPIPKGKLVMHLCNNPACCEPEHLKLGTYKENREYCMACRRTAQGDLHGARLHPETRPRGSQNGRAKLNETQVREIRLRSAMKETCTSIAGDYNVSIVLISKIVRGEIWKHLGDTIDAR